MAKRISLSEHFTMGKILRFALPSIFMMIFTSIYTIVDGFFVSRFAGSMPFAGLNFVFPFISIVTALGFMFGTGGAALIGKYLGQGRPEKANAVFSMITVSTIVCGFLFMGIGELAIRPLCVALGAKDEMLNYALQYGRTYLLGTPFCMLQFLFQPLFVVAEKPRRGFLVIVAAGVLNMILDLVFVGLCGFGIIGAACATIAGFIIGGGLPIVYFLRKNDSLLRLGKFHFFFRDFGQVCLNGLSEYVGQIAFSVIGIIYNYQLLRYYGENGVSAYGVLLYIGFIFVAIFIGYNTSVSQIVSFHYGAGNKAELKSLLRKSLIAVFVTGVAMVGLAEALDYPISFIFVGYDEALLKLTVYALRIYAIHFLFSGFSIFISGYFTALNDGITSAIISFVRTLIFEVSFIIVLPLIFGADSIWWSVVGSEVVSAILAFSCLFIRSKKFGYLDKDAKNQTI